MNTRLRNSLNALSTCLALFYAVPSSMAAPLLPYSLTGTLQASAGTGGSSQISKTSFSLPGTYPVAAVGGGLLGGDSASAILDVDLAPIPSIGINLTLDQMNAAGTPTVQTNVALGYQFQVNGPAGTVPVIVNADGGITVSPFGEGNYSHAALEFLVAAPDFSIPIRKTVGLTSNGTTFDIQVDGVSGPAGNFSNGFAISNPINVTTNQPYTVRMDFLVNSFLAYYPGTADISTHQIGAFLDPTFTLASSVLNPEQYSFSFSPGIGNGAPVPLPSAMWLLLSGLIGGGMFFKRSR